MFRYCETKVEHFAPYLLKDGLVLRITKYLSNQENAEEVKITNYGGGDFKLILVLTGMYPDV